MANLAGVQMDVEVPESGGDFQVLPAGYYKMVIINDLLKDNRAGNGKILKLKLQVIDGPHKGVTIDDYINLTNPHVKCQAIGQGTLKKICRFCGVQYPPQDTVGLYGKPMSVNVTVQDFKSNTTGKDLQSNSVKGYSEIKPLNAEVNPQAATETLPW